MQMTSYKLSFNEMGSLMLFLRDVDWDILKNNNQLITKFIYDTCRDMYENLEKRGLRILANKRMDKPVKISFSDLEMLSISLLAKYPHGNACISSVVNKVLLELPVEVIHVLNPIKNEQTVDQYFSAYLGTSEFLCKMLPKYP